jgi:hypothetical protein
VYIDDKFVSTVEYIVLIKWQVAINKENINCDVTKEVLSHHPIVSWQPVDPFISVDDGNILVHGLTYLYGYGIQMVVGYKDDLSSTALGHEMGHAILYACGQNYSEPSLLAWTTKYDLPY